VTALVGGTSTTDGTKRDPGATSAENEKSSDVHVVNRFLPSALTVIRKGGGTLNRAVVATTGRAVWADSCGSGGIRRMTISPCGKRNYSRHNNLRSVAGKNSLFNLCLLPIPLGW
jgi:hypothetical protein